MKFTIGRIYILKINGIATKLFISPKSSVPQGSHFGPICFIIFTNDLDIEFLLCYADDTKAFRKIRNLQDRNKLQEDIDKISKWSIENNLTLNVKKTYHVSYGRSKFDSIYTLNHNIIEKCITVRDLGIIFDSGLTFKPHIESIARRLSQISQSY